MNIRPTEKHLPLVVQCLILIVVLVLFCWVVAELGDARVLAVLEGA